MNDDFFMAIAAFTALRSRDVEKVGACIVNKANEVVGIGWNGTPAGTYHRMILFDSAQAAGNNAVIGKMKTDWEEFAKKCIICACRNAILFSTQKDMSECRLFTTRLPSWECAVAIREKGIKEVHYIDEPAGSDARPVAALLGDRLKPFKNTTTFDKLALSNKLTSDDEFLEDETYMAIAFLAKELALLSLKSEGERSKAKGACLVCENGRVIAIPGDGDGANSPIFRALLERRKMTDERASLYLTDAPEKTWANHLQAARITEVVFANGTIDGKIQTQINGSEMSCTQWLSSCLTIEIDTGKCEATKPDKKDKEVLADTINKDDICMGMAILAKYRCAVPENAKPTPTGVCLAAGNYCDIAWNTVTDHDFSHAEGNLLLRNLRGVDIQKGSSLYVTQEPCGNVNANCAALVSQLCENVTTYYLQEGKMCCRADSETTCITKRFPVNLAHTIIPQTSYNPPLTRNQYYTFLAMLAAANGADYHQSALITSSVNSLLTLVVSAGCNDKLSDCPARKAIFRMNQSLANCNIYLSHYPCDDCAKLIAQSGIKHIYSPMSTKPQRSSFSIFNLSGVGLKSVPVANVKFEPLRLPIRYDAEWFKQLYGKFNL